MFSKVKVSFDIFIIQRLFAVSQIVSSIHFERITVGSILWMDFGLALEP